MADKMEAKIPRPVTDAELQESFAGPAVHANKMILTTLPAGARLSFLEAFGEKVPPAFRTAVLMSYEDALELRDLLSRQLKDIEEQLRRATA